MTSPVAVSVSIVNYRKAELLRACLRSVTEALDRIDEPSEILVVDNGSDDGSREVVRDEFPGVDLVALPENRGFCEAANTGVLRARGEWVLLLNNDTTLVPDAVAHALAAARRADDVGAVATQMRFARRPGVINSAGIGIDRLGTTYDRLLGAPVDASEAAPVEVFGASGGAALYRRAMFEELGGFDRSFFVFLEDADLAWRARMAGWRCLYAPEAIVYHHHSITTGHTSDFKYFLVGRNRMRLLAKNAEASLLARYGPAMALYDAAYVLYAAVADRSAAPLRGRLAGLREWRSFRRAGSDARRPVALSAVRGPRAALARRGAWVANSAGIGSRAASADGAGGAPQQQDEEGAVTGVDPGGDAGQPGG